MSKVDATRLRELFTLDADTGVLSRIKACRGGKAGPVAGSQGRGYLRIHIDGRDYYYHCIVWLYVHGDLPAPGFEIDHINRISSDNRPANLRAITVSQNNQNRGIPKNNTSGIKGVCWATRQGKWKAQICINGKQTALGFFDDVEAAASAYEQAASKYHSHRPNASAGAGGQGE